MYFLTYPFGLIKLEINLMLPKYFKDNPFNIILKRLFSYRYGKYLVFSFAANNS